MSKSPEGCAPVMPFFQPFHLPSSYKNHKMLHVLDSPPKLDNENFQMYMEVEKIK